MNIKSSSKDYGKAGVFMWDFKQRLADWRQYKSEHKIELSIQHVVPCGELYVKSRSWFLLQSVEKRKKREEQLEKDLREILDNARQRNKVMES